MYRGTEVPNILKQNWKAYTQRVKHILRMIRRPHSLTLTHAEDAVVGEEMSVEMVIVQRGVGRAVAGKGGVG